jgi:epoxyqueuosine reductase
MKQRLRQQALGAEGRAFAMGVCRPGCRAEAAGRLRAFLAAGRHGQMGWMAEREAWRGNRGGAVARGAVGGHAGRGYTPEGDPMAGLAQRDRG